MRSNLFSVTGFFILQNKVVVMTLTIKRVTLTVSSLEVFRTVVIVFTATGRLSLLSLPAGAATLLQVALTPMMIMTLLLVYLVPAPPTRGFTSSQDPVQAHHSVPSVPLRHIAVYNPTKYFIGGHVVPRRRSRNWHPSYALFVYCRRNWNLHISRLAPKSLFLMVGI